MKHFAKIRFLILAVILLSAGTAMATDTEPPLGLPLLSTTPTATETTTDVIAYTVTPTVSYTVVSQEAVDDAETGPDLIILAILSLVAGIGFFLIKKYFDLKRYSL